VLALELARVRSRIARARSRIVDAELLTRIDTIRRKVTGASLRVNRSLPRRVFAAIYPAASCHERDLCFARCPTWLSLRALVHWLRRRWGVDGATARRSVRGAARGRDTQHLRVMIGQVARSSRRCPRNHARSSRSRASVPGHPTVVRAGAALAADYRTFSSISSRPFGSTTWTAQAMHGSNEWMVRWISSGWSALASVCRSISAAS